MDQNALYGGINICCEQQTNVVRRLWRQQKCAPASAAEERREKVAAMRLGRDAGK